MRSRNFGEFWEIFVGDKLNADLSAFYSCIEDKSLLLSKFARKSLFHYFFVFYYIILYNILVRRQVTSFGITLLALDVQF